MLQFFGESPGFGDPSPRKACNQEIQRGCQVKGKQGGNAQPAEDDPSDRMSRLGAGTDTQYQRQPGQDWFDALNTRPTRVGIGSFKNAEAVAFGNERRAVIVTGEARHSPLLLIDFGEEQTE